MPCPEKFEEALAVFDIPAPLREQILCGYDGICTKSKKPEKAAFFKRAVDLLDESCDGNTVTELLAWCACCKSGAREKASKEFARINAGLPMEEKLAKIRRAPYMNMGQPCLTADKLLTVNAVSYIFEGRYACACSNFRRVRRDYPVSKSYCNCCGGHFQYHYQIMLGVRLRIHEVCSSPLDSDGKNPCVFSFEIVD